MIDRAVEADRLPIGRERVQRLLIAALDPADNALRSEVKYTLEMLYGKVLEGDEVRVIDAIRTVIQKAGE